MTLRVNGATVSEQAIEHELKLLVQFYASHMPGGNVNDRMEELRRQAREQAIGAQLLMQEAARLDIPVSETEIDESMARMISEAGGEEAFARLLERQGLAQDVIRDSIRRGKRIDKLIRQITRDAPDPAEEEIREYYELHRDSYARPERALAMHILIEPRSCSGEDRAEARRRLLEIREQCVNGEDFSRLAAAFSECPSGRKTGGSLGWISRGTMVPAFEDALFATPTGEVSDLVETVLGFHIVKKADYEAGRPASFDESREAIRDLLRHNRNGRMISQHVEKLRSGAVITDEP